MQPPQYSLVRLSDVSLADEIVTLVEENDTSEKLLVHPNWLENFREHVRRLLGVGQVLGYCYNNRLVGVCGWALVDDSNRVNKIRWTLPDNITTGHILYVTFGVITSGCRIGEIKKFFDGPEMTSKFDEVKWLYNTNIFNVKYPNRRIKCRIAD